MGLGTSSGCSMDDLTGGLSKLIDEEAGIRHKDCGHDDWGFYPTLQEIYILWCKTCGTLRQMHFDTRGEIDHEVFINPKYLSRSYL